MARSTLYAEVVDRGHSLPVEVQRNGGMGAVVGKAGYAPDKLDTVIRKLVQNAEAGAQIVNEQAPMMRALMQELSRLVAKELEGRRSEDANEGFEELDLIKVVGLVDKIATAMERLHKMVNMAVKSKDDASRLRSFLAGDQDGDDLAGLSEVELRRKVMEAAGAFKDAAGFERGE